MKRLRTPEEVATEVGRDYRGFSYQADLVRARDEEIAKACEELLEKRDALGLESYRPAICWIIAALRGKGE